MEFFELIEKRRSVRSYLSKDVEDEKLEKILKAANSAPSAGNLQAYRIYITKDREKKKKLAIAAFGQKFIAEAPVVLVFCANPEESGIYYGERGRRLYSLQDATIAATFAMLACYELGLATCWVGAFDEDSVRRVMGIPKNLVPIAILPIGYPKEKPEKTGRKRLSEIVKFV